MKVLGLGLIQDFSKKHNQAKGPLDSWYDETRRSNWKTPQDIKDRYRSADFLADNVVIFDIKGNSYRLVVHAIYVSGIVIVKWVGTHAEYSKKRF